MTEVTLGAAGTVEGGVTSPGASIEMVYAGPNNTLIAPTLSAAASMHKNLESFPGQVLVTPPRMSAKQETKLTRKDAVRMARNAERTSEHIRGGIDRKADMVVGATLRVHAQPDWDLLGLNDGEDGWKTKKPFAQACQREFNNWAYDSRCLCDAEGHYNFGGMMWMAFRNLTGPDAETAGVIHYDEERAARYNSRWATFVTIIDPDRIETPAEKADDESIYEGKRLDEHGRMIGMYIHNRHPSEGTAASEIRPWTYVPRETYWGRAMSFHWFVKTRGGQQRGVTSLVTILKQSGQIDTLDEQMVSSAIIDNVLSTYIESLATAETVAEQLAPSAPNAHDSPFDMKLGYYEKAKIRIGGARIPVMPPGDKIHMDRAKSSMADPTAFRNNFLRQFASAIGISFEQLSQNFSDANYSAARAALLEVWRGVLSMRKLFTAHVASLIYAAVIEEAVAKGRIKMPAGAPPFQENRGAYTACAWTGPGMGWIDPQKEANAIETMLRIKVTTRANVAAERGEDYLENFDQIEQELIEAEERGFTLDPPLPGEAVAEEDPDKIDEPKPVKNPAPKKEA